MADKGPGRGGNDGQSDRPGCETDASAVNRQRRPIRRTDRRVHGPSDLGVGLDQMNEDVADGTIHPLVLLGQRLEGLAELVVISVPLREPVDLFLEASDGSGMLLDQLVSIEVVEGRLTTRLAGCWTQPSAS